MEKIKTIVIIGLALLVFSLYFKSCQHEKDRDSLIAQLEQYKISDQQYKVKIRSDSSTITTQQQTFLTQNEALRLKLVTLEDKIKKLQSYVTVGTRIYIDSIDVPFLPEHFADTTGLIAKHEMAKARTDSVAVPAPFHYSDKWFSLDGEVLKKGLHIDSLSIPNKTTVSIGYERKNIFSRLRPVVKITNDNKYLQVTGTSNVIIKEKKSFLNSRSFWFGLGAAATVALKVFVFR